MSFDPVKGGYAAAGVDAALDRLEDAFARRERDELIAEQRRGSLAARDRPAVRPLRGRLHRPDGERFRRPAKTRPEATTPWTWTELCHDLIGYLEEDKPLSVDNVRRAVFRPAVGKDGYEETQVDAFLDRVVELMAAID